MRVLMFGWEFPPHISGGLGTACLGLTKSLAGEKVDLLFVVPKLFGGEPAGHVQLVGASSIFLPYQETDERPLVTVKRTIRKKNIIVKTEPGRTRRIKETSYATRIEVESSMIPYTSPEAKLLKWPVERWNYVFTPGHQKQMLTESEETIEEQIPAPGFTYAFTGGYGHNLLKEVEQYAAVSTVLAQQNPHDVIHCHDWMTYPAGIAAKKVSGKPLVIHVHATEFDRSGHCGGPVYELEREGMKQADKIVAVSKWTKDIIVDKYAIAAEKIIVVHNGIIREENGIPPVPDENFGSQVVTFLGRITRQKGPAYFVEAARKVAEKFPDAHFVVAGSGDLLPQTIERVAQLRLSKKFHFTGFLNKEWISKLWSISSVYVMPSVSEPFGITPLEAIQAGVPVIVSNQSGVAEVMPHALKVNFWDTEALAESICSVLKYESLSRMLKARGELEIKKLSWKTAAQKLKNLYEEIAS
jgi:glycogen synthase